MVDEPPSKDAKAIGAQLHSILDFNNDGKLDVEDVKFAVRSILDVNGDGKVDAEDVKAALASLLDVNRDGKVDVKDVKAAFSLVLMTGALFLAPPAAHAKGGGGHGGGHGHGSHGRSGSRGVSSGKYDAEEILVDGGVLALAVVVTILEDRQDEEFDREFSAIEVGGNDPPRSGIYLGVAREVTIQDEGKTITTKSLNKVGVKKEIEQDSRADLTFSKDGTVRGKGYDYMDGPFTIRGGKWRGSKVRWREDYEDGFSTTVRGTIKNGKIKARYVSDRFVRGEVRLTFSSPLDESGLVDKVKDVFKDAFL